PPGEPAPDLPRANVDVGFVRVQGSRVERDRDAPEAEADDDVESVLQAMRREAVRVVAETHGQVGEYRRRNHNAGRTSAAITTGAAWCPAAATKVASNGGMRRMPPPTARPVAAAPAPRARGANSEAARAITSAKRIQPRSGAPKAATVAAVPA